MKNDKINVAAILKDAPHGTKLYSPLCGDCWLITADYSGDGFGKDFPIIVSRDKDGKINALRTLSFTAHGTLLEGVGECMLFPSKEMRDWEKFSEPKFKDGDIVIVDYVAGATFICICKKVEKDFMYCHARVNSYNNDLYLKEAFLKVNLVNRNPRYATDFEKQQLLDALAKAGKRWNAETKTLEDLPKKHVFMPFDKVLVRDHDKMEWHIDFFNREDADGGKTYFDCLKETWMQCIPYEGNEHLLGTTGCPKEGGKK